jgi:hypothetical protein
VFCFGEVAVSGIVLVDWQALAGFHFADYCLELGHFGLALGEAAGEMGFVEDPVRLFFLPQQLLLPQPLLKQKVQLFDFFVFALLDGQPGLVLPQRFGSEFKFCLQLAADCFVLG